MDITSLEKRFEFYAINVKDIRHNPDEKRETAFFKLKVEEIQKAVVSTGIKFPALFLQTPEAEKSGSYDNESEKLDFTFVVLVKKKTGENYNYDVPKQITDKIYNRLKLDVVSGFIPGTIPGTNEGEFPPVTDQIYGWAVSISISDAYDAEVKQSDWEDLS